MAKKTDKADEAATKAEDFSGAGLPETAPLPSAEKVAVAPSAALPAATPGLAAAAADNVGDTATDVLSVLVEMPVGPLTRGFRQRHLDLGLDAAQAATLRQLIAGMQREASRLANGRYVQNGADAVRFWLESAARQIVLEGESDARREPFSDN